MTVRSLNRLEPLRHVLLALRRRWLELRQGVRIDPTARVSLSARLVAGPGAPITIGAHTLVAFKTLLLAQQAGGRAAAITIGRDCFIGGGALILPGVTVHDGAIVGAGAVVSEDVPPRAIVAGNAARILQRDAPTGRFGRLQGADENEARLYRPGP